MLENTEFAEIDTDHFLEQIHQHLLDNVHDLPFIHERGLDVDLGEFRLPVGTQVFIPEAPGDLVVTIEPRHHQ